MLHNPDCLEIQVSIDKITDYSNYPGWVECSFYDAWNNRHLFIEKIPVVTELELTPDDLFPQMIFIKCTKVKQWEDDMGREIIRATTERPNGIETIDGECEFDFLREQVRYCRM